MAQALHSGIEGLFINGEIVPVFPPNRPLLVLWQFGQDCGHPYSDLHTVHLRRRCRVGDEVGKGSVLLIGQGCVKADSVLERVKPGCFAVSPRGR